MLMIQHFVGQVGQLKQDPFIFHYCLGQVGQLNQDHFIFHLQYSGQFINLNDLLFGLLILGKFVSSRTYSFACSIIGY